MLQRGNNGPNKSTNISERSPVTVSLLFGMEFRCTCTQLFRRLSDFNRHRRSCLAYSSAVNQPTYQGQTYAHGSAMDNSFRTDVQPDLLTQNHFQPDAFASSMSNDFCTQETLLSEDVSTFHEEDSIMLDGYISDLDSCFGSPSDCSTSSL